MPLALLQAFLASVCRHPSAVAFVTACRGVCRIKPGMPLFACCLSHSHCQTGRETAALVLVDEIPNTRFTPGYRISHLALIFSLELPCHVDRSSRNGIEAFKVWVRIVSHWGYLGKENQTDSMQSKTDHDRQKPSSSRSAKSDMTGPSGNPKQKERQAKTRAVPQKSTRANRSSLVWANHRANPLNRRAEVQVQVIQPGLCSRTAPDVVIWPLAILHVPASTSRQSYTNSQQQYEGGDCWLLPLWPQRHTGRAHESRSGSNR